MTIKTGIGAVLGIAVMAAFSYYVWPFRYERISEGLIPSAVDHMTGQRVFLGADGWQSDSDLGDKIRPEIVEAVRKREGLANVLKAKTEIAILRAAVEQFHSDTGRYPTDVEGFGALRHPVADAKNWRGPYLVDDIPLDPWGSPYVYASTSKNSHNGYQVKSLGDTAIPGVPVSSAEIAAGSD